MNSGAATSAPRMHWGLLLAASATLMITMGARQTTGLFVSPIHQDTGIGIAAISFALAIGQFTWGVVQPVFGAIADKHGPTQVLVAGGLMLALGSALTPFMSSSWGLMLTLGLLSAAGAGAGSFSILIGATASQLPAEKRSFAAGFINAGGSLGQFVFAPLVQLTISAAGWMTAMFGLAAASLLTLPLAWPLRRKPANPLSTTPSNAGAADEITLRQQLHIALRNRSYWLLHLGFFTCGFHIAFLVTHLPGEIALCGLQPSVAGISIALIGLFNIAGSLVAGALGQHYRMKMILAVMYASRAVMIVIYLLAPPTPLRWVSPGWPRCRQPRDWWGNCSGRVTWAHCSA